jgi:hypothetical protein
MGIIDCEEVPIPELQEIEKLLASMTQAEKAQLLQWVVQDLDDAFPGSEIEQQVHENEAA